MGYPLRVNSIRTQGLLYPKTGGKFGTRARGNKAHYGWDLAAAEGTAVFAVGPGEITAVGHEANYGHYIQLKFIANGSAEFYALYAHLSIVMCRQRDRVTAGKILGFTGRTGNAKNQPPHLHFEIAATPDLRKGRKNHLDPAVVLGDFLATSEAGDANVIESGYLIEIIDLYEKTKNLS